MSEETKVITTLTDGQLELLSLYGNVLSENGDVYFYHLPIGFSKLPDGKWEVVELKDLPWRLKLAIREQLGYMGEPEL